MKIDSWTLTEAEEWELALKIADDIRKHFRDKDVIDKEHNTRYCCLTPLAYDRVMEHVNVCIKSAPIAKVG